MYHTFLDRVETLLILVLCDIHLIHFQKSSTSSDSDEKDKNIYAKVDKGMIFKNKICAILPVEYRHPNAKSKYLKLNFL